MKVEILNNVNGAPYKCVVTKEPGDKIRVCNREARGESTLLHHIKKILNARGYDLIKKRMWKDGHMMGDMQQYLRTRKPSGDPKKDIYIWNGSWNVQGADFYLKEDGKVNFIVESDVFNVPERK
jgi:hypothetical protein